MVRNLLRARPPGRNDLCPCGSGKKYKKCCLTLEEARLQQRTPADVLAEVESADARGDAEAALRLLEDARRSLAEPDLLEKLAERYRALPADRAEEALRSWWDADHDRFSGAALAQLLVDRGRNDEAFDIADRSDSVDAPASYWSLVASLRHERGDVAGAVVALEYYTRLAPDDSDAWVRLGCMQETLGHVERALQALRRASDASPGQLLPRLRRLEIMARAGRWREVRDLAETVLGAQFEDSDEESLDRARSLLASAYAVAGSGDAARSIWHDLLRRRPQDDAARLHLARLELECGRPRLALAALTEPKAEDLDIRLRALLMLGEYDAAMDIARAMDENGPSSAAGLVESLTAAANREYVWALDVLPAAVPEHLHDLWLDVKITCLSRLGRWQDLPAALRSGHPSESVLLSAAVAGMAAGKLDIAERLVDELREIDAPDVGALAALLPILRQVKRTAETRRQQQSETAERQRWHGEARDLRKRVRELERHVEAMAAALEGAEAARERLLAFIGVSVESGVPSDWEQQVQRMAEQAHQEALREELQGAESRLRGMLGDSCWQQLSEAARSALREGEWLFASVAGDDRDYGAALMEYARGLERAFKDAIFRPIRAFWQSHPGSEQQLTNEGHDPSLGPFVRFVLAGGHLTLGSMAAALDRMGDVRRQGVCVNLMRRQVGLSAWDEWALADWQRTAAKLARAADLRNRPAHAGTVSQDAVIEFRDLVLGTGGLLAALATNQLSE